MIKNALFLYYEGTAHFIYMIHLLLATWQA